MVSVKWSADALRDLENIDTVIAARVVRKVAWLGDNFPTLVPEKLHQNLKGLYKLRVGDYRVMYSVHANMLIIEAIGHRRNVYEV